ncbi:MAG: site-2 protease family protein [bacterium]|nr:site-2 protease family protein [bacterium]
METGAVIIAFQIIVLVFSVMIHEVSHGLVALKLGDRTALNANRLNLNPFNHLDPFGSVILPFILALAGGPIFGWAKPVPYNPYNLRNPKSGGGLIAAAGPASNVLLALIFALIIRASGIIPISSTLIILFNYIVIINLALAFFNLIPIPPLDGSKVLFSLLPTGSMQGMQNFLNRYGFFILLSIVFFGIRFLAPLIQWGHALLVGPNFGL